MVADLQEYPWTSYAAHGLGQANPLLSEVPVWSRLGATEAVRQASWRQWVHVSLTEKELAVFALVYNLVRSVASESAKAQGVAADRVSVTDTVRWLVGAEGDEGLAFLGELQDDLGHPVDEVDRVVRRDANAVRVLEDALAPVVEQLPGLVEHHVRVLHPGENVDVVLGIDGHGADLTPLPAGR